MMSQKYSSNTPNIPNKDNRALIVMGTYLNLSMMSVIQSLRPISTTDTHSTKIIHRGMGPQKMGCPIIKKWWMASGTTSTGYFELFSSLLW